MLHERLIRCICGIIRINKTYCYVIATRLYAYHEETDNMKRKLMLIIMTVLSVVLLVGCFDARAEDPYTSPSTYEQTRINMLQAVEPAVVAVQTDSGFGSGVIFQKEDTEVVGEYLYYVLTNYHVIESVVTDQDELRIYYGSKETVIAAKDYQGSEAYDIAVVRFVSDLNFTVIDIKPISENITTEIIAGQDVYAIGTPNDILNFNYITSGVVSLVTQTYNHINNLAIMHDAELNPGNSGGPLFNLNGEVIGINVAKDTWISTESGNIAAEGLNYALNINTIAPVIRNFNELGYTNVERRPKLGVTVIELADYLEEYPEDADQFEASASGIVVVGFDYTRNAYTVLEELDLIVAVNGTTVATIEDLSQLISDSDFGDTVSITVVRKEGASFVNHTFDITLS